MNATKRAQEVTDYARAVCWCADAVGRQGQGGVHFFPGILIQLIGCRLLIAVQRLIRLQQSSVGLYVLMDKLHRLAAHPDLVRQDLRLFAFNHASDQQHDLFWLQASSLKDCLPIAGAGSGLALAQENRFYGPPNSESILV